MRERRRLILAGLLCSATSIHVAAQMPETTDGMYVAWCAPCHGRDGTGRAPDRPLAVAPPDFTSCRFAAGEPDEDWTLVTERGGAAAGRSPEMPPFAAVGADRIRALVAYLRTFCRDARWPSGNFNFTRSLSVTKAFPENEATMRLSSSHGRPTFPRFGLKAEVSRRIGPRAAIEVGIPIESVQAPARLVVGAGDLTVDAKYAFVTSARRRFIASAGVELVLPTGSRRWGFGEGTVEIEPYLAAARQWQGLDVQAVIRGLIPWKHFPTEPVRFLAYDVAVSKPLTPLPRAWTLGVEVTGIDAALGIGPYLAHELTRDGAWSAAVGVRVPVRPPRPYKEEPIRWLGYLRWDYGERRAR